MRVIAYTYDADVHCPCCTRAAYASGQLKRDAKHPYAESGTDYNDLPCDLVDREWNVTRPLFSYAIEQEEYCGDCHEIIPETEGCGRPE